jgi:type III pantothenate kinase
VVISNVAGEETRCELTASLPTAPPQRWIASVREQCGVRNSYADPAQLGCDRWAALIGARRFCAGTALVVNAGTALTVDALTADGVFLGGIIVPGAQLMHQSLAVNTAGLKPGPGGFSMFPDNTDDAIVSGAIDALCGAIERMARFLEECSHAAATCVLSGGGAALIAEHLNLKVKVVDNLVLEGLLMLAHQE